MRYQDMNPKQRKNYIVRRWRQCGFGRLYWRRSNPGWRRWDQGDVAAAIDGVVSMHFKSIDAILEVFAEVNCGEK